MAHWIKYLFAEKIPEEFAEYAGYLRSQNSGRTPISQVRFVVVDTETTGLDSSKDRILSVAAVEVVDFQIAVSRTFEAELQQSHFNHSSIAIHEITPGSSASGQAEEEVMRRWVDWLQGAIIIGLNVDFDYQMLSGTCRRVLGFDLRNKRYELLKFLPRVDNHFAHRELFKPGELSLEELCNRYKIPVSDRHTAAGDALATALLFMKLLKKLEKRGVKNLSELLRR